MRLVLEKSYITIGHHSRKVGIRCSVHYRTDVKMPVVVYLEKTADGAAVDMVTLMLSQTLDVLRLGFGDASSGHCACGRGRPTSANISLQATSLCSSCTVAWATSDALPKIPAEIQTMGMVFDLVLATSTTVTFKRCYNAIGPDGHLMEQQTLEIAGLNLTGVNPRLARKRMSQLSVSVYLQRFSGKTAVGIRGNNKARLNRRDEAALDPESAGKYTPSSQRVTFLRHVVLRKEDMHSAFATAVDAAYRLRHYGVCPCVGDDGLGGYGKLCIPSTGSCWQCSLREFLNS